MPHIQQENILQLQNQVFENTKVSRTEPPTCRTPSNFLSSLSDISHRPSTRSKLPSSHQETCSFLSLLFVSPLTLFKTQYRLTTLMQHLIFVPFTSFTFTP